MLIASVHQTGGQIHSTGTFSLHCNWVFRVRVCVWGGGGDNKCVCMTHMKLSGFSDWGSRGRGHKEVLFAVINSFVVSVFLS